MSDVKQAEGWKKLIIEYKYMFYIKKKNAEYKKRLSFIYDFKKDHLLSFHLKSKRIKKQKKQNAQ